MSDVICKEVVITTLARRGLGVKFSPCRRITQVYDKDGTLIAEHDPMPETFSALDLVDFARWAHKDGWSPERLTTEVVNKWLDSLEANQSRTSS